MIKKFLIIFLLFIGFFSVVFADMGPLEEEYRSLQKELKTNEKFLNEARVAKQNAEENLKYLGNRASAGAQNQTESDIQAINFYEKQLEQAKSDIDTYESVVKMYMPQYIKAKKAYDNSPESANDLSSIGFKIPVGELFPGNRYGKGEDYEGNIYDFLMDIIQKLMIALGSIALLIIVIGSSFMILYHGEDSMLTKGKSIFSAGIIALVVALASYYMIEIVKYLISLN